MSPREIVHRAIEFRGPDRVPIVYFNRDTERSDVLTANVAPAEGFVASEPGATEWGYVWHKLDETMGQPREAPLADAQAIDSYKPPDPTAPGRLDHLREFINQGRDRFLVLGLGITGFDQATFLRGMEQLLVDLYTDRKTAEKVLDLVFNFENSIIEQAAAFEIDCVKFGDDWGTQRGLMISPELWRAVFKPRYAQQFQMIHAAGKKVWFHSCGNVYPTIGDLIDIGADVLEFLQPDVMGIDNLARDFGGKVCFCCSVDHQRVAISGSKQDIFDYAGRLISKLGSFDGGFIACIEDYSCLGMSEQNYQWICEAFSTLGREKMVL
ncbi:MAG: uroporphyrinogen decarboxylase family protein [Armatimonadota bacterium]